MKEEKTPQVEEKTIRFVPVKKIKKKKSEKNYYSSSGDENENKSDSDSESYDKIVDRLIKLQKERSRKRQKKRWEFIKEESGKEAKKKKRYKDEKGEYILVEREGSGVTAGGAEEEASDPDTYVVDEEVNESENEDERQQDPNSKAKCGN